MHPIENLRYVARAHGAPAADLVREAALSLDWLGAAGPDLVIACRRIVERQPLVGQMWWLASSLLAAGDTATVDDLVEALDADPTARHLAHALDDDSVVVTIGRPDTIGDALARRGDVRVWCADSQHDASSFLARLERSGVDAEPVPNEYLARAVAAADLVLVEALAVSDDTIVAPVGSQILAAVAAQIGRPIWLAAPLGTRLPKQYVDAIASLANRETSGELSGELSGVVSAGPDFRPNGRAWEVDVDAFTSKLVTHVATGEGVVATSDADSPFSSDCAFLPELLRWA